MDFASDEDDCINMTSYADCPSNDGSMFFEDDYRFIDACIDGDHEAVQAILEDDFTRDEINERDKSGRVSSYERNIIVYALYIYICIYIYNHYCLLIWEFCTPALADGFLLEVEWTQVSSVLQDSSQYSSRSQQCCSLDGFHYYYYYYHKSFSHQR